MPAQLRRQKRTLFKSATATAQAIMLIASGLYSIAASSAQAAPPLPQEYVLPTVTVTANKQRENLQKVPQSITVISGIQARDANLSKVDDLSLRVPNLYFSTGGMQMINLPSLRGVNSNPHNNTPGVTLYVDDVPVAGTAGFAAQLYGIASIEVLRGPQGTLYGKNSEGGVIKITTNKPGPGYKGEVGFEAGNKHYLRSTGSFSGELVEGKLYAGGALQVYEMDGWVKNDFKGSHVDDKKNYSGRGSLRYTPTDDLEAVFTYNMLKYDEGTFGMYDVATGSSKRHTNSQDPGRNQSVFNDQSLSLAYTLSPSWSINSVTTRREAVLDYRMDYDFSPMQAMEVKKADKDIDWGQELRLTHSGDTVNAVLGVAYAHGDATVRYHYYNMGMKHDARSITESFAGFGQAKIHFAEKWAVTVGARLEHYTNRFTDHDIHYSDSGAWTSFSPKLALEYAITPDNTIYTSVSRGFRPAGYDTYHGKPGTFEYDEEELWAFELGSKNTFWDNKAVLNAALFYHKFNNMQLECYVKTPFGPMPTIQNAGSPSAFGGEIELNVMPLAGLELFGSAGYTHMRYGDFHDALGDHKGNEVPYVPKFTYNIGSQYRHETGFFGRAEVVGSSTVYLDSRNNGHIPAHSLVNAKIGWEFETFDVYVFGKNVFDKRYDYINAFGGTYGLASQGAMFGGEIAYRF